MKQYHSNCIIYLHKNSISKKVFYVGIGTHKGRPFEFKRRGKYWDNYTKKYGLPRVVILKTNLTWQKACELEIKLIGKFGRKGIEEYGVLVNRTKGGEGAYGRSHKLSLQTKRKISLRTKEALAVLEVKNKMKKRSIKQIAHSKKVGILALKNRSKESHTTQGLNSRGKINIKEKNGMYGNKWMHKNFLNKMINVNELECYLRDGWLIGKCSYRWITNGEINKYHYSNQNIENGWKLGFTRK